jgi:uncharacterized protein DUF4124
MVGKCLAVLFVLAGTSAAAADIVKWTDANGRVHYGEKAPPGVQSNQVQDKVQSAPAPAASSSDARRPPDGGSAAPRSGGRARTDDADAVPYLTAAGRERYREFLSHPSPRAFVICPDGRFSTLYVVGNYQDKLDKMLRERQPGCEPYVINDAVVWGGK